MPQSDAQIIDSIFKDGGLMSQLNSDYEFRSSQYEMARCVLESLENSSLSLIDAPTGIGKSLAYLIPAMLFAVHNSQKVVVATDTNTLLSQLMNKDAPMAAKILQESAGVRVNFSYVKGKGHYLCYRRYENFINQMSMGLFNQYDMRQRDLDYLSYFYSTSKYAQDDEIDERHLGLLRVWGEMNISPDYPCSGCDVRDKCKYYSSLVKKLHASHLIITNHSLLLSDARLKMDMNSSELTDKTDGTAASAILPPFSSLVVDEAHNLVKNCEKSFEMVYSTREVNLCLMHLLSRDNNLFMALLGCDGVKKQMPQKENSYTLEIASRLIGISENILKLNKKIASDISFIFSSKNMGREATFEALDCPDDTQNAIYGIISDFCSLKKEFSSIGRIQNSSGIYEDIVKRINQLDSCISALDIFIAKKQIFSSTTMHWIECYQLSGSAVVEFKSSPLFAGEHLDKLLYSNLSSCVFTSATLDSGDDFKFYVQTSGLGRDDFGVEKKKLASPFDYKSNTLQLFINDIDTYSQGTQGADVTASFIAKAIKASRGGALILFTSFYSLNEVYKRVENMLKKDKITLLAQGSGESNASLVKKFRKDEDSVLFATSSFWEGVDFSGDTLRLLILHKIPFAVPSAPLHRSRSEYFRQQGRDFFREYDIPEALVKMRQGTGRLMRKSTDRGVIAILDGRIAKNPYYKTRFYDVLDKGNSRILTSLEAVRALEEFFRL